MLAKIEADCWPSCDGLTRGGGNITTEYFVDSDGWETPEDEFDELRAYEMAAEFEHILAGDFEDYLKNLWAHGVTSGDLSRR